MSHLAGAVVLKPNVMDAKCPNCGKQVDGSVERCPNCGAALKSGEDVRTRALNWALGKPMSGAVAWTFLIAGGLFTAFMAGCGLFVGINAIPADSGFGGLGWFFFVLGLLSLAYVIFDFRRSIKNR